MTEQVIGITIIPTTRPAKKVELANAEVHREPARHVEQVPLQEHRAEEAVDHARDSGHEIHQADQHPLRPWRRVLRDVQRHSAGQRKRHAQGGAGDEQRADEHRGDAEVAGVGLPGLRGEKGRSGPAERLASVLQQETADHHHDGEHQQPGTQQCQAEEAVGAAGSSGFPAGLSFPTGVFEHTSHVPSSPNHARAALPGQLSQAGQKH
ncbi:hypothetical protein AB0383_49675 [Amycolatopsis sp. NPDC051373]|uniref:hypothetical protein n=1 Tax=Amycolatopsis sp. NPDC051373 TaxID=3155801 RepID=UPI00344C0BB7